MPQSVPAQSPFPSRGPFPPAVAPAVLVRFEQSRLASAKALTRHRLTLRAPDQGYRLRVFGEVL